MPLYEYRCESCGEEFERLLGRDQARAPQTCPRCGSRKTARRVSTFCSRTGSRGDSCAPSG